MRVGVYVVTIGVLLSAIAAADPAPLDAVTRAAALAGRPLVVEFTASWCQPCKVFEQQVLAHADVVPLLADVEYVSYDVDTKVGQEAATRLNAYATPTVVSFVDNFELERIEGVMKPDAFIAFLDHVRHEPRMADLQQRVVVNPADHDARRKIADKLLARGDDAEAVLHLQALVKFAALDPVEREATITEWVTLAGAMGRDVGDEAMVIAKRKIDSRTATPFVAMVWRSRPHDPSTHALIRDHLSALESDASTDAIRLAIVAGDYDLAGTAIQRWHDQSKSVQPPYLLRVELAIARDHMDAAARGYRAICNRWQDGYAYWCWSLDQALATKTFPVELARMRDHRGAIPDDIHKQLETTFAKMAFIEHACGEFVTTKTTIPIITKHRRYVTMANKTVAERCASMMMFNLGVDAVPREYPVPTTLRLGYEREREATAPPTLAGVVLMAYDREHVTTPGTRGVAVRVTKGIVGESYVGFFAAGELALGIDSAGNTQVDTTGQLGLAYRKGSTWIGGAVGAGATNDGLEILAEARLRTTIDTVTGYAWARAANIGNSTHPRTDTQLGIAAAFRWPFYIGATFDDRGGDRGGSLVIGLPIGSSL